MTQLMKVMDEENRGQLFLDFVIFSTLISEFTSLIKTLDFVSWVKPPVLTRPNYQPTNQFWGSTNPPNPIYTYTPDSYSYSKFSHTLSAVIRIRNMCSLILLLFTNFFLLICLRSSNARLLSTIVIKPSISLQVERGPAQSRHLVTNSHSNVDQFGDLHTENVQDKVSKLEGKKIVESSSSHRVALVKRNHVKDHERPPVSSYTGKGEVENLKNDDVVLMDYQPPHRKTPIHNK
ncbi:uncharacterized protein [Rutidosis leptorrhynchoides]|uniref:uncharacterized protein n=1 Tax=Rutidosis leptorrhynchoides TaxID=125765 RepID=UPI003A9A2964